MDVKIDATATRRPDRWSWLNVILDELLDGTVHRLDGSNSRELLASAWAREESEGGSWAERRIRELVAGQHRLAQQAGGELGASPAPRQKLEIHDETPQGGAHGAILGPIDAYKCLAAPLTIFVEDADSDGEFWVTIWTAGERERLRRAFEDRRIEFAHCGGKNKIPARFARWSRRRAPGPLRALVLKDSDKLWATHTPTDPTDELEDVLPTGTHRHTLKKREIENYLPRVALNKELEKLHQNDTKKRPRQEMLISIFCDLPTEMRAFYDVKEGFKKVPKMGAINQKNHIEVFEGLDFERAICLYEGFGDKIGSLFEAARELITREALGEVCDFEGEFVPILDRIEALL